MNRQLLLPVAGTLVVVLLLYLVTAGSVSVDPTDPSTAPTSSALKEPAPTLLEQHADAPVDVRAVAALADAGLGELVVCRLASPLPGQPDTAPWPTAIHDDIAAFLVDENTRKVSVRAPDGVATHDLSWSDDAEPVCSLQERWVYTVEATVVDVDDQPVTDAQVRINGRLADHQAEGRYVQRRSSHERPAGTGAPVVVVQATRGQDQGAANLTAREDTNSVRVKLGEDRSALTGMDGMRAQAKAMRELARSRSLGHAFDKALARESVPAEVTQQLADWRGTNARRIDPSRFRAPTPALRPLTRKGSKPIQLPNLSPTMDGRPATSEVPRASETTPEASKTP